MKIKQFIKDRYFLDLLEGELFEVNGKIYMKIREIEASYKNKVKTVNSIDLLSGLPEFFDEFDKVIYNGQFKVE